MTVQETRSPLQIVADNRRAAVRTASLVVLACGAIIIASVGFLLAHFL